MSDLPNYANVGFNWTRPIPERAWLRLTQKNGGSDLPIIIKRSAIISVSPVSKDMLIDGTFIMLAGDQRPIKVVESLGNVCNLMGWTDLDFVEEKKECDESE